MKKIIYIEPRDINFITDRHMQLFYRMIYNYSWELRYEKYPKIPSDCEKILIWQGIAPHRPDSMSNLINLRDNIKVIWYIGDIWFTDIEVEKKCRQLMDRADVLLSPMKLYFETQYSDYIKKMIFFPHFISPIERFEGMGYSGERINKLLISGGRADAYPLRNKVRKDLPDEYKKDLEYPGVHTENHKITNYNYAKYINSYYCALATCGIYKFAVGKYFEIPACKTIMLANKCSDVTDLGFIAGEHYVAIDEANCISDIMDLIDAHPVKKKMRDNAYQLVMENHTIDNRLELIKDLL